jgi:hypothetical protein
VGANNCKGRGVQQQEEDASEQELAAMVEELRQAVG